MGERIVCLLPVRNGESHLEAYLESAARFADAVVALDDGSVDRTNDILRNSALVELLLENPPRPDFRGWDDGANRNRLLHAAGWLDPDWIVSLDVDERIDADDAQALRGFLKRDAIAGCAFGLRHFRMWGEDTYDPEFTWVYRLFAYRPGQRFPAQRLHFDPVPESISPEARVRTTIRVRHYGAADEQGRRARLAKYREADPEAEYPVDFGGLALVPMGPLPRWAPRPSDLPVLVGPVDGVTEPASRAVNGRPSRRRARVVCLLPARNCAHDLPGYFESAGRVADAVAALDDGSTDGTRALLEREPLVKVVLRNPRRTSYRGWNDEANRARLLTAAAELDPDWVLWLDADERLAPDDAAALRQFVDEEALPDHAYGFRVFRMIDGLAAYDRADLWAYRLFAFERGQRLPAGRLHAPPVPTSIPREHWLRTTIRIQHLGGSSDARRRARLAKYREADPGNRWQDDYRNVVAPPGPPRRWEKRPADLSVPDWHNGRHADLAVALDRLDLDAPALSAIVIARDDEDRIERAVRAVVEQNCHVRFEVIVVVSGTDRTAAIVRERFPDVTLIELPHPALPGEARNAGLRVARGDYVTFPGSHVELAPGSLAARMRAHELGYSMVTGCTLNGTDTPAGWASYFLDHSVALPGRPPEALRGVPAHCSYLREHLLEVGGFPEDMRTGEDTVVNHELRMRGYRAYHTPDLALVHNSPCRTPAKLFRHHFKRGRGLGRILLDRHGGDLLHLSLARRYLRPYVRNRLERTERNIRGWGDLRLQTIYRRVRPLARAAAYAALLGTWWEILRPRRAKARLLFGRRGLTLLVGGLDGWPGDPYPGRTDVLLLVRLDFARHRTHAVALPRELVVEIPGEGRALINAAYNLGRWHGGGDADGVALVRKTVAAACGVPIDHHVLVDFRGFARIVDALGGVELDVPEELHDETPGGFTAHFTSGPQRMSGFRALDYVRTRKADGGARRVGRHLDVLLALLAEARRIRSPLRLARVVVAAGAALDTSLGLRDRLTLARHFALMSRDAVTAASLPRRLLHFERTPSGASGLSGDGTEIAAFAWSSLHLHRRERPLDRPWTYLSPHFRLEHFDCQDGTPVPPCAYAAVSRLCHHFLEPMRDRFGPAVITSGYRTAGHNERVGGTEFSYHVYELRPDVAAADVEFAEGTPADWAAYAVELGAGGVGRYDRQRFVHIDMRDSPARWNGDRQQPAALIDGQSRNGDGPQRRTRLTAPVGDGAP